VRDVECATWEDLWDELRQVATREQQELLESHQEAIRKHAAHESSLHRLVVELVMFGGCSLSEAAAITGISKPTVDRRLKVALAFLRKRLGESFQAIGGVIDEGAA
jgi:DNA-directed RNA polymerase specialized sigma24 family protein